MAYLTKKYLSTKVELEKSQVEGLKAKIARIKQLAEREYQTIQILKKFYKVDIQVNLKQ